MSAHARDFRHLFADAIIVPTLIDIAAAVSLLILFSFTIRAIHFDVAITHAIFATLLISSLRRAAIIAAFVAAMLAAVLTRRA